MVTAPRCLSSSSTAVISWPPMPRPRAASATTASTGRRSPRSSASGRSRRIRALDRARRLRPRPAPRNLRVPRRLRLSCRFGARSAGASAASRSSIAHSTSAERNPAPCEMMSTSCARSDGNRDRVRMGASLECEVYDAPDHLIVAETGGAAGAGESAGILRQIAVGIDVDDVGRAVRREAEVEATVVAQLHRGERGARHRRDALRRHRQAAARTEPASCRGIRGTTRPTSPRTTRCAAVPPASPRSRISCNGSRSMSPSRRPSIDT